MSTYSSDLNEILRRLKELDNKHLLIELTCCVEDQPTEICPEYWMIRQELERRLKDGKT